MIETLWRVVAPYYVAGFVTSGDVVIRAAPIINWFVGLPTSKIINYCAKRGFSCEKCSENTEEGGSKGTEKTGENTTQ